jgi:DNA-binding protein H-NS
MASYSELMAQAQTLMAQAEQARKDELASVIADIKAKMKQFGISVADLGGAAGGKKPLWAGGPGRKPEWVRAVLASGKSVDDYLI